MPNYGAGPHHGTDGPGHSAEGGCLEAFPLQTLALQLAGTPNGLGFLTSALFRGLLEVAAQLHFPKNTFALHLLFQSLQRLIDIIVANENLNQGNASFLSATGPPPDRPVTTHRSVRRSVP